MKKKVSKNMYIMLLFIKTLHRENGMKVNTSPWLVWLSGLSAGLQTKRSLVRFPVRAHAWVVSWAPSWGRVRGSPSMYLSHSDVSLSLSPSLPLSVRINKNTILKKKKVKNGDNCTRTIIN